MKNLRLACFVLVVALCAGSSVRADTVLRWYPPVDPDLAGYRLYLAEESMQYDTDAGIDLGQVAPMGGIVSVDVVMHTGPLDQFAVVTAYDATGNESPFSAEDRISTGTPPECLVDGDCQNPELCMEPASCQAGTCVAGLPLQCPAPGACQVPTCALTGSCTFDAMPDGTTCDDGDPVSLGDMCIAGACTGFECAVDGDCAGSNPDLCRDPEVCNAGSCQIGAPLSCPVPTQCQVSTCALTGACSVDALPDGTACDDGDEATLGDQCGAGVCTPGDPDPFAECRGTTGPAELTRLSWTGDPGSSALALWTAPFVEQGSFVRYHRVGDPNWTELVGQPSAIFGCTAHYVSLLEGLEPGEQYEYTASGAGASATPWSQLSTFRAAETDLPQSWQYFAFLGSVGLQGVGGADPTPAYDHMLYRKTAFVLGGGDYANADDAMAEGSAANAYDALMQWFGQSGDALRGSPFLPVYGDREAARAAAGDDFLDLVHPAADAGAHGSYAFDADGSHFVALHAPDLSTLTPGTPEGDAHLAWLDADLAAARPNGARFIVVYMHADLYSSESGHQVSMTTRDALTALFERHRVNLVLSAGGEGYERSHAVQAGQVTNTSPVVFPDDGVVYIRAGSAGWAGRASWAPGPAPEWSSVRDATERSMVVVKQHSSGLMLLRVSFGNDTPATVAFSDVLFLR